MATTTKTYSRRLFVTYQQVIEGRKGRDLDGVVAEYAAANKGVDLEQKLSFAQWFAENTGPRGARAK